MFYDCITSSPMISPTLDEALSRIGGYSYDGDISFVSTLRALLLNRVGAEESTYIRLTELSRYDTVTIDVNHSVQIYHDPGILILYSSSNDDNLASKFVESSITLDGVVRMNDIEKFILDNSGAHSQVVRFDQKKLSVILTDRMNYKLWHLIQSMIPRFLPWFFDGKPITDDEKDLLVSLTMKRSSCYKDRIRQIADRLDLRKIEILSLVGRYEADYANERKSRLNAEIERTRNRMVQLMDEYSSRLSSLNALNEQLCGLDAISSEIGENSELVDYLSSNKSVRIRSVRAGWITFTVATYLENFDPEAFSVLAQNRNSHIMTAGGRGCFTDSHTRKKLLRAIFSDDPIIKVRMAAAYRIKYGESVQAMDELYLPDGEDYIPNPHVTYYSCLGNHATPIYQCLEKGDMVGAMEQCVSSAKSLNLVEPPTTTRFLRDLFTTTKKCCRLPDGSFVSPAMAVKYLDTLDTQQ